MLEYQNIFETFNSTEHGLDTSEAVFRQTQFGPNQLSAKKEKSILLKFLAEFADPMMLLLIFASGIALYSGDTTDALMILGVLIINGIISFLQQYRAEKAMEALKKIVSPQTRVIRNHQQSQISTTEIVPGDVIILNEGDNIPADAIIFQANEFATNEAILTGETYPINKTPFNVFEKGAFSTAENIVYTGTIVTRGNAKALVCKTGMDTEFGKIANLTQQTIKDKTPLQKEIHKIGIFAAQITIIIVVLIFAFEYIFHNRNLIDNLLFSSSIAVAAVPEGLPAVITIALALGVQRLSKKKAIIRQLSSVETLGATTVICTDKTGTLTKNEMTVSEALVDDYYLKFEGIGYAPEGKYQISTREESLEFEKHQITPDFIKKNHTFANPIRLFGLASILCNNASLEYKNNHYSILGDPTEGALLVMAQKLNFFTEEDLSENLEEIHELPFDSDRKLMTKIFLNKKQGKYYIFCKGAPDQLIPLCDQRLHLGKTVILTKGIKEELLQNNEELSQKALRTICLAYKEISAQQLQEALSITDYQGKIQEIEKKFIYLGIAGISDPPREEVKEAVKLTKIAGIKSYIITGDHGFTTAAIAKQIGLISDDHPYEIITGTDLDQISDDDLKQKLTNKSLDIIFARSKPEHKLRIVSLIKSNNEIVAVTGDGVNDAPALKRADIGVAMGITGSDVSKESANMILMDDSYSTIVTAIQEGRTIYANLKKFIYYIFSTNIGEVLTIFLSLIVGLPAPLTAVLLLTINFVTDLFPALALGIEPAEKDIMKQKPRSPDEKIMNKEFIRKILITGTQISVILLGLYYYKLLLHGWSYGQNINEELIIQSNSIIFVALVIMQIIISFNSKTNTASIFTINPFNNLKLITANLFSLIITISIVEIPFLQNIFHTSGLTTMDWMLIVICCLILTTTQEIIKYLTRKQSKVLTKNDLATT